MPFFTYFIAASYLSSYYKKNIIKLAVEFFDVHLKYEPSGCVSEKTLYGSRLFVGKKEDVLRYKKKDVRYRGEDLFSGTRDGYRIMFCDAVLTYGRGKNSKDYHGGFVELTLQRHVPCTIVVKTECEGLSLDRSLQETPHFGKFTVFTDNVQIAEKLISSEVLREFLSFYEGISEVVPRGIMKSGNCDVAFSIHDNKLVVFVPGMKDMFEASILYGQKKSATRDLGYIMNAITLTEAARLIDEGSRIFCPSIKAGGNASKGATVTDHRDIVYDKSAEEENLKFSSRIVPCVIIIGFVVVLISVSHFKYNYSPVFKNGEKYVLDNGRSYFFDETDDNVYWTIGEKYNKAMPGMIKSRMYLVPRTDYPDKLEAMYLAGKLFTFIRYKSYDKTPADTYVGMTEDGIPNGYGVLYRADGARIEGYWKNSFVCDSCLYTKDGRTICTLYELKTARADTVSYPVHVKDSSGKILNRYWRGTCTVDVISKAEMEEHGEEILKTMDEFDRITNQCIRNNRKRHNERFEILNGFVRKYNSWL